MHHIPQFGGGGVLQTGGFMINRSVLVYMAVQA